MSRLATTVMVMVAACAAATAPVRAADLEIYESKYYIIHSDLSEEAVQEAILRMDHMFEEYRDRTRFFAGRIDRKFPFYLYSKRGDYLAASGVPGSAGAYVSAGPHSRLLAYAGTASDARTWEVIQHEGFHQFVDVVIGGDVPLWINEGLAEYFSHAIFTGDGYVVNTIPPQRLARLQQLITARRDVPLAQVMVMDHDTWTRYVKAGNSSALYDQAWSLVYFLVNADDGRYHDDLIKFLQAVGDGGDWVESWKKHFGDDVDAFDRAWRRYWLSQPDDPTAALRTAATARTLANFAARAIAAGQDFDNAGEFFAAARGEALAQPEDEQLPAGLLAQALAASRDAGMWSYNQRRRRAELAVRTPDGWVIEAEMRLRGSRVPEVEVSVESPRRRR